MHQTIIHKLALKVKEALDNGLQILPITQEYPNFSLEDAYKVQMAIHDMRLKEGFIPVGRKIGFTNKAMWQAFGVEEPVWAYMYEQNVFYEESQPLECSLKNMCEAKIEPELVIHLSQTPKENANLEELLLCIDWIAIGYEIVQSNYANWKFTAPDVVADFSLHAQLYVGQKLDIATLENPKEDLKNFSLELCLEGVVLEKGYGSYALDSPLQALFYLMKVLEKQEGTHKLKAGEIITMGTLTQPYLLKNNQRYISKVEGLDVKSLDLRIKE